jgi:hypothetical protein
MTSGTKTIDEDCATDFANALVPVALDHALVAFTTELAVAATTGTADLSILALSMTASGVLVPEGVGALVVEIASLTAVGEQEVPTGTGNIVIGEAQLNTSGVAEGVGTATLVVQPIVLLSEGAGAAPTVVVSQRGFLINVGRLLNP